MKHHESPLDWREWRRRRAWALKQQGWKQKDIAEALGVTPGAVSQWCTRAHVGGVEALRRRRASGRPPKLMPQQIRHLPELLAPGAEAYGFRGQVRTTKRVAHLIGLQFGVQYHPAHMSRLLRAVGWSVQQPIQRATQRNEADIKAWREERWPALKKRRLRNGGPLSGWINRAFTCCQWRCARTRREGRHLSCGCRSRGTTWRRSAASLPHPEERDDLLSLLLHAQDEDDGTFLTDAELRDEIRTLLFVGHETTANALTWAWYLLMQHPEWYDRLAAEVETVLEGRAPGVEDLPRLKLAQHIFQETLRLYPPASLLNREILKPIAVDGHALKPGMTILISLYVLHRRPDCFPDPDTFDPDRFANDAEKTWLRMAYLPFAGGTHLCIGNHFALLEGPLILATLAERVRFQMAEEAPVRPIMEVTLRPSPFEALVHRRERRPG